jgi:NAD+ kinase
VNQVGILYHPRIERARTVGIELGRFLEARGVLCWICSAWDEEQARAKVPGSGLILSIGGDGTILRAVRAIVPHVVPVVGINLGHLGFMTELTVDAALTKLPDLLQGEGWIEERAMIQAELLSNGKVLHGLNDVFVGRRSSVRLVRIEAKVDGELLTTYRADGLIVATATGSTGYSLAGGGPILYPEAKEMIVKPVCPHFCFDKTLVLPPRSVVVLRVITTHEAVFSLDGQVEMALRNDEEVRVRLSPYVARFLRIQPRSYFYASLEAKLKGTRV